MAYRRKKRTFRHRLAKKKARLIARKSYRAAIRMPKKKLAKVYANQKGRNTYVVIRKKKSFRHKRKRRY